MRRSTIRKVEDLLRDYPNIDKYIEQREQELRYPMTQEDENIGGGHSQSLRNERALTMLITIDEDRRLNTLKRQREVIDDCLDGVDEDTQVIIGELYFRKRPQYTVDGLVVNHLVHCSRRSAYRLKKEFISECAKRFGLYDLD